MIQAAINPETKEFLGLIIPATDLDGAEITLRGHAKDWEAILRGELLDPLAVAVIVRRVETRCGCKVTVEQPGPHVERVEVENLACPPG